MLLVIALISRIGNNANPGRAIYPRFVMPTYSESNGIAGIMDTIVGKIRFVTTALNEFSKI